MKAQFKAGTKKIIEKELSALPPEFIVAVVTSNERYSDVNIAITDYLINKRKMCGLYVTMNKPYETLVNILKKNKIDPQKFLFVDAISSTVEKGKEKAKNCITLQSPSALTSLSIIIEKGCDEEDLSFVILDSLSTMLVYNNDNTTVRFIHNLIGKLRKSKRAGIVFSLEEDMGKKLMGSITQICDKVIKI